MGVPWCPPVHLGLDGSFFIAFHTPYPPTLLHTSPGIALLSPNRCVSAWVGAPQLWSSLDNPLAILPQLEIRAQQLSVVYLGSGLSILYCIPLTLHTFPFCCFSALIALLNPHRYYTASIGNHHFHLVLLTPHPPPPPLLVLMLTHGHSPPFVGFPLPRFCTLSLHSTLLQQLLCTCGSHTALFFGC